jgi:hypothetical protein
MLFAEQVQARSFVSEGSGKNELQLNSIVFSAFKTHREIAGESRTE